MTSTSHLKVLQAVNSIHPEDGGITKTVTQLSHALSKTELCNVEIISNLTRDGFVEYADCDEIKYILVKNKNKFNHYFALDYKKSLEKFLYSCNGPKIIHCNGIWMPSNHWSISISLKNKFPVVCQTHGMLEPWSMKHNQIKKKLAFFLYQKKDLIQSNLLIATSEDEHESIRSLGFKNPIAIIPNGIDFPRSHLKNVSTQKKSNETKTVLFLSRIHKKKGLINLIKAWSRIRPIGWQLKIVGPDEGGYKKVLENQVNINNLSESVFFYGAKNGKDKELLYRNSDIFVLPTFSENFGIVVAEALSYGVPVITTKGAPWKDIEKYGCGWWIDIGVEPLEQALRQSMSLTNKERSSMGEKGKLYVKKYNWNKIAYDLIKAYEWVLYGGSLPSSINIRKDIF